MKKCPRLAEKQQPGRVDLVEAGPPEEERGREGPGGAPPTPALTHDALQWLC